jgi:hypothetical protein
LRDRWGAVVSDADALGLALQEGLPTEHQVDEFTDLAVWRSSVVGVGCELARPLVVMPLTSYEPDTVTAILEGLRRAGIDVVHVVLGADEAVLRARIHARPLDALAKRWCLEHLRAAVTSLRQIGGAVQHRHLAPAARPASQRPRRRARAARMADRNRNMGRPLRGSVSGSGVPSHLSRGFVCS